MSTSVSSTNLTLQLLDPDFDFADDVPYNAAEAPGRGGAAATLHPQSGGVEAVLSPNRSTLMGDETSYWQDYYDNYDYDYDHSVSTIPPQELVPVALVYGLTLLFGVVGNVLVIVAILRNRRMQTVTNTFLTSLASSDLLLMLLCVPIKFAKFFTFSWTFGEVLCKMVHYMQNVSVICSILTMTAMSVERYYAIVHPMKAKFLCTVHRAKRVIICVWVTSILLAVPICFGQVHKEVGGQRKAHWCVKEWTHSLYAQLYEVGMLLVIFLLPLVIVTFAYATICINLWRMTAIRAGMTTGRQTTDDSKTKNGYQAAPTSAVLTQSRVVTKLSSDDTRTRRQVIKMLVMVIVLFAICWGPTLIDNVLVAFNLVEQYNYGHLKYMRQAFSLMAYFNSCVNPIVYAFMSRNFRESFKKAVFGCCPLRRNERFSRQMSFTTRCSQVSFSQTAVTKYELDSDCQTPKTLRSGAHQKLLSGTARNEKNSDLECETAGL